MFGIKRNHADGFSTQGKSSQERPAKRASLRRPISESISELKSHQRIEQDRSEVGSLLPLGGVSAAGNDDAIEEGEDADALHEVIMCVDMREKDTVGCCYYVARDQALFVMADVANGGTEIIESLKLYIQPSVVILSTRVNESVESCFDPDGKSKGSADGHSDEFALPYIIECRPSPEFAYETGKNKLATLDLSGNGDPETSFLTPGDDDNYGAYDNAYEVGYTRRRGDTLRLSAWIDMESRLTIGCAGALLTYIGRRKSVEYLPNDATSDAFFRISLMESFSLQDIMFVNADTLASLQIIQSESSPNTHSQGPTKAASGSKEGLSVYGLFHRHARTPQGKALVRQYFLRPSLDLDVINERLDATSVLLRSDNESALSTIVKSLGQVKNMRTVMIHLRKGVSNGLSKSGGIKNGIWSSLRSFAFYALQIREALTEIVEIHRLAVGTKALETFDLHNIALVGRAISERIDFNSSAEMHRTVVNVGIDPELDEMKRTYDGLGDLLSEISHEIAETVPALFDLKLNVVFFPQIGFLIAIPNNATTGRGAYEGGEDNDTRWERIFSTVDIVYYKNIRMRELDQSIGDLYAAVCDKEIDIIHELGQQILAQEAILITASDLCGELDSLVALAQGARNQRLCKPKVSVENIIDIKGGRHPLQELTVPSFVPNDTFITGGPGSNLPAVENTEGIESNAETFPMSRSTQRINSPSMLMMTGPNFSGKSIYMKQVALIVYMAHVGCFVPADQANIGLTDKILTRVATRETVSKSQSAFMIDLQQVAFAMKLATHKSLVVIDEFGKGTDSSDGAGLASAVFEYFLALGDDRPKILGATHFHEIFEHGFLVKQPFISFGHMVVRLDREVAALDDQITYLYNFRDGRSSTSYGSCCATLNGVDTFVVQRADELAICSANGEDLVAACARISRGEEEDLKDAEEQARHFLAQSFRATTTMGDNSVQSQHPREILDAMVSTTEIK